MIFHFFASECLYVVSPQTFFIISDEPVFIRKGDWQISWLNYDFAGQSSKELKELNVSENTWGQGSWNERYFWKIFLLSLLNGLVYELSVFQWHFWLHCRFELLNGVPCFLSYKHVVWTGLEETQNTSKRELSHQS